MNIKPNPPYVPRRLSIVKAIFIGSLFLIGGISSCGDPGQTAAAESSPTVNSSSKAANATGVGQALQTEYFSVTVNKVSVVKKVNTGDEFSMLKAENGIKYLVIDVTFKNTDNESRMLADGEVHISYNGKDYNFDKSETVMAEGYGLFLDQINPLTQKSTKLVYKLPEEVTGTAYYNPGRADADQVISLGEIK